MTIKQSDPKTLQKPSARRYLEGRNNKIGLASETKGWHNWGEIARADLKC